MKLLSKEEKQRIDSREPWSEKDSAIYMANKALDTPFADPDSDLCTISRQFLRAVEQLARERELRKELVEKLVAVIDEYATMDIVKIKHDYPYYEDEYKYIRTLIQKAKGT